MTSEKLFKKYLAVNNLDSFLELSQITKIEYTRLRKRIKNPSMLRLFELQSLDDALHFSPEDFNALAKGEYE